MSDAPAPAAEVLSGEEMRLVERYRVAAARPIPGTHQGNRLTKRKGSSIEFADFRNYSAGDDLRHIDWASYSRTERLYLKQFYEEEDLTVSVVIDRSASMAFASRYSAGSHADGDTKLQLAQKIGAVLGISALHALDRFALYAFDSLTANPEALWRPHRGRQWIRRSLAALGALAPVEPRGTAPADVVTQVPFATLCARLAAIARFSPGVVVVISDFLFPDVALAGLRRLGESGFDVVALRVVTKEEVEVPLRGDFTLVDAETGREVQVSITRELAEVYRKREERLRATLENGCRGAGLRFAQLTPGIAFPDLLRLLSHDLRLLR